MDRRSRTDEDVHGRQVANAAAQTHAAPRVLLVPCDKKRAGIVQSSWNMMSMAMAAWAGGGAQVRHPAAHWFALIISCSAHATASLKLGNHSLLAARKSGLWWGGREELGQNAVEAVHALFLKRCFA